MTTKYWKLLKMALSCNFPLKTGKNKYYNVKKKIMPFIEKSTTLSRKVYLPETQENCFP